MVARLDINIFGHALAPDKVIDGIIRHPAGQSVLARSAVQTGYAAGEGVKVKAKRYL